jgi:enoyl-CoA hydratase
MTASQSSLATYSPSARDARIGRICLNRPEQRNAIDTRMAFALREAVNAFEDDASAHVAILGGAGPVFCAGMDLAAFAAGERPGLDDEDGFAFFVRRRRRKPIIAAVQGGACDLAVATIDARFALPEVKRGIIAAGGGAVRLPSRIPLVVAREMLLTGDPITAARAYELGLLNAVVSTPELDAAAEDLARKIAINAPLAVAASLSLCEIAAAAGEADGWAKTVLEWRRVEASDDASEGAVAFKEKRDPVWRGA